MPEDEKPYRGRDDIQIWREIAGQGSTLLALSKTTEIIRTDLRKHQDDEVMDKERQRLAMDIMSGNLATHSQEVASRFNDFSSSINSRLDTFESAIAGQLSEINDTLAQAKGGGKVIRATVAILGTVVTALSGFIAWVVSFSHLGGKP